MEPCPKTNPITTSNMKNLLFGSFFTAMLVFSFSAKGQADTAIYLLVRGDDIGSSQSANEACIESYRNGIVRSVELMAPCAWFPEAVKLLRQNPGLDVGVHLVVTSEWSNIKWRPLTPCPSLVDSNGYFYPMIWPRNDFPSGTSLREANWNIEEIEQEFRAQIELVQRHIPWVSHMGCHMGCEGCAPEIAALVNRLAKEYRLDKDPFGSGYQFKSLWLRTDSTAGQRIQSTLRTLQNLAPGKYFFIDHPGYDTPEMRAIWHTGYENVAADRDAVTRVFTSEEVKQMIKMKGIRLVSYANY